MRCLVAWMKKNYGQETNRLPMILDGAEIMAENIAPRLQDRAELFKVAQLFLTTLKEKANFEEMDQTS